MAGASTKRPKAIASISVQRDALAPAGKNDEIGGGIQGGQLVTRHVAKQLDLRGQAEIVEHASEPVTFGAFRRRYDTAPGFPTPSARRMPESERRDP